MTTDTAAPAPVTAAAALMADPAAAAAAAASPPPAAAPAVPDSGTANTPAPEATGEQPAPETPPALTMPGKDATPEEWAAFYNQLGRPETPDAYQIPVPEGDDGAFAIEVAPMLHEAGLTQKQIDVLAPKWNEFVAAKTAEATKAEEARIAALHAKNTAEAAELKNEWGQKHDANMEFARRAVKQFMPSEKAGDAIAALEGVLGYKGTIAFLHGIGAGLGEHDASTGLNGAGAQKAPEKTLAQRMYPNMPN